MAYSAEISRANPSCFLFLIDQSGSMEDPFGSGESAKKKKDGVADAINRLLQNLAIKCAKQEGVRDYYNVGVIGYGAKMGPAFGGPLAGRELVPISEVANNPMRVDERIKKTDDGAGGLVDERVKFPIWFEPIANGGTPMCQALTYAEKIMKGWIDAHPGSFPPIVINITDGEATDGDASTPASNLSQLATADGSLLLFNIHLSSLSGTPIEYPDTDVNLPDEFSKLLFKMSSTLPDHMQGIAAQQGMNISSASRGFVFNADMVSVIKFLDIGTRASNLR
jgi:uncharacterized protein YegL